mgnify:CR=1 FL=1
MLSSVPPMAGNDGSKAVTQADGTVTTKGAETAAPSMFGGDFMTIFFVIILAFVVMTMLGGRKEKKKKAALLASIGKNDVVQSIGGMIGRIVSIENDRLVIEVDRNSGSRVTLARQAVQQVLTQNSDGTEDADQAESD